MLFTHTIKLLFSLCYILTLFHVYSAKGYSGVLWGLRWKWKYVQTDTGEKISEELLCDLCIPLPELNCSSHRGLGNPVWRKSYHGTFRSIWTAVVKKEISSDKNWKEAFCESAFCYVYSFHVDNAFFTLHSLETLSWTDPWRAFGSTFRTMVKKEISSDKNQKEAFCETAMCHVNSSHSVKLLFSLSSFLTLFMFSMRRDIQQHSEAYGEKGNMFR